MVCPVHKSPPLYFNLIQLNPLHVFTTYWFVVVVVVVVMMMMMMMMMMSEAYWPVMFSCYSNIHLPINI
jgi:hypothetical protein